MECRSDYCIYNKHFKCILEEISIDYTGLCDDCCIVHIDDEDLQALKDKQLKSYFSE